MNSTDVVAVEMVKRKDGSVYPHFMFSIDKSKLSAELTRWPHMAGRMVITRFDSDDRLECFTRTRREGQ